MSFFYHRRTYPRSVEKEINIYVGLTEMQRKWYRSVLEKDIDAVNGKRAIDKTTMNRH